MPISSESEVSPVKPTLHARTKRDSKTAKSTPDTQQEQNSVSAEPVITRTALIVRPFDTEARDSMVAEAAYFRAEHRSFAPGYELEDWLASEADIDEHLYRLYGEGRSF